MKTLIPQDWIRILNTEQKEDEFTLCYALMLLVGEIMSP